MALATRCPACTTVFRISTAQAAAKGGMVRCGQCRNVFDSLDALVRVEDLEVIDEVVVEAGPMTDGDRSALDPRVPPPSPDEAAAPLEPTAAFESFGLADEKTVDGGVVAAPPPARGEWWLPEGARDVVPPAPPPSTATDADVPSRPVTAPAVEAIDPSAASAVAVPASAVDDRRPGLLRPLEPPAPPARGSRWLFGSLAALASIVLLGQAAYLWRDELAVRWPPARPWLAAACAALSCRVQAPAHPDAITIESAAVAAQPSNPNVYVLTALLRNREAIAVRYPHLELVLTDLQDRPVLRRALRPEDYLPADRAPGSLQATDGFAADSELPVRVVFELTDLRFAGYRLDRFYP